MKNYKSIVALALAGCMAASLSSCRDDMTDDNKPTTSMASATPTQLFVNAIFKFQPDGYGLWFANAHGYLYAAQMACPSGSITDDKIVGGAGGTGTQCISLIVNKNAMLNEMSQMSEDQAEKYKSTLAALDVLICYLGLHDTDDNGEIPFTEAGAAGYGGTLTPKYDTVESLYDLWLNTLSDCMNQFLNPSVDQITVSHQDIIYGWDWNKWAKLANSLRLKIATRLIHRDLAKAKSIVASVVSAPCGVISSLDDDFYFHKADDNLTSGSGLDAGDVAYNTTNTTIDYNGVCASGPVVNYLVSNGDPRVRFLYEKNNWNSKVVNYYLQNGHKDQIPSFVLANVETEVVDGKESFKAWKGKGEPWVRYYGLPVEFSANTSAQPAMKEFYQYGNTKENGGNQISVKDGDNTTTWSYRPYSTLNEELVQGRIDYGVPRAPGDAVINDTQNYPHYGMYLTAAEVNLYLAEFATYGGVAGLGNANDYFQKGVRLSVERWDKTCADNHIPYYGTTYNYDPNEKPIDLQEGEIEELLKQPNYKLTGDKDTDLEKIFLNMLIHFTYQPKEVLVTTRRSGVPKFNSTIFPRFDYASNNMPASQYPRRTRVQAPSETDLMAGNVLESYSRQGFSYGSAGGVLNTERVWQDQGAPQYGAGPSVK